MTTESGRSVALSVGEERTLGTGPALTLHHVTVELIVRVILLKSGSVTLLSVKVRN